jgi:hypothetical protein
MPRVALLRVLIAAVGPCAAGAVKREHVRVVLSMPPSDTPCASSTWATTASISITA